jgi:hypothetical protein
MGLHHMPHESQITRSNNWLTAQARLQEIDRAKEFRARQRGML